MSQQATTNHKGRISARVPLHVQETIQQAAELIGVTMNAYIVQVMLQHAQASIDRFESKRLVLSEQDSERFFEQLANPRPPNTKLREAMASYRKRFHDNENLPTVPNPEGKTS